MNKVVLRSRALSIMAEFYDNEIARRVLAELPLESVLNTWGEEIYFTIPALDIPREEGTMDLDVGDLAFWPEGNCLCVFFGRTPASHSDKPVPASEVMLVGKVTEGLDRISGMKEGDGITVEAANPGSEAQ